MSKSIGIFAGTTEGRLLFYAALKKKRRAVVFVATEEGRRAIHEHKTRGQRICDEDIHVGKMTAREMVCAFKEYDVEMVFDATHPFAVLASSSIREAAHALGLLYIRVKREEASFEGKNIRLADSMDDCCALIRQDYKNSRVLFTTGTKEARRLREYFTKEYIANYFWFRILAVEENRKKLLELGATNEHMIIGCGPFSVEDNKSAIATSGAAVLVTKESGKQGGFLEKLSACEECQRDLLVIKRPKEEGIFLEEACRMLEPGTVREGEA